VAKENIAKEEARTKQAAEIDMYPNLAEFNFTLQQLKSRRL
jgi:hypothetical protein